ncbi:MAG: Assimilatory nitrate reductase catalytic subunit [Firmicutes bacterium ADurb.Bin356]|nr:MAG: Assimilatory nitrate reductase catalytic subunit [Firmicutes bacterium ADurb.Bin356]
MGESKVDWEILSEIMRRLGYENKFQTSEQIMDEIASLTPQYGGISFTRLENESLCWPCPDAKHPGTPTLHMKAFSRGERAKFIPHQYKASAELPDAEYPYLLTTGRVLYQYHTRTMTGKNEGVNQIAGWSYIEINPADAKRLGVADGGMLNVKSRRGEVVTKARVTDKLKEGVVFMPFHYADSPANKLTNAALDPIAKIPEFKVCAVTISRA